jgi:flagellar biogenesis protein FliO
MNKGKVKWIFLVLVIILGLGLIVKPLARPRARAQRIQAVNNISSFSVTIPITNAQPAATSNK